MSEEMSAEERISHVADLCGDFLKELRQTLPRVDSITEHDVTVDLIKNTALAALALIE